MAVLILSGVLPGPQVSWAACAPSTAHKASSAAGTTLKTPGRPLRPRFSRLSIATFIRDEFAISKPYVAAPHVDSRRCQHTGKDRNISNAICTDVANLLYLPFFEIIWINASDGENTQKMCIVRQDKKTTLAITKKWRYSTSTRSTPRDGSA
ncbi:MAG: hypothetical protein LBE61_10730 [Burkholderiaceae bacterium]|nr:hypothetical protein [Burkholderiaceae bacterium]